ncbi:MAG: addiction module protein [Planctomycetota bacterium]
MVINTKQIIEQIELLPVEGRAEIIDSLLRTMNQPDPENDATWIEEAQRRLDDLRAGRVQGVAADEVFAKARERFIK